MSYRIQYFLNGKFMHTIKGRKSLSETRADAIAGLILHGTTYATILDMGNEDKLIATVER
jgi:hypothetical protein